MEFLKILMLIITITRKTMVVMAILRINIYLFMGIKSIYEINTKNNNILYI